MPTVDVLLHGYRFGTDSGIPGFCSIILVTGEKRTLVDVGHVGRRTAMLAALERRGLTPADIDVAVMSHAHWDHNQNFDLFEHAPLLIHPWERRYAQHPHRNDWSTPRWTGAMVETHPRLTEVDEGYEIEPGVRVIHTPGHSPGSICLAVDTEEGRCILTADVVLNAMQATTRKHPIVFWNERQADKSIARVLDEADIVYPGHDQPFRLVDGEVRYEEPMQLTITGVSPDEPGLTFAPPGGAPSVWIMPGIEDQTVESLGLAPTPEAAADQSNNG